MPSSNLSCQQSWSDSNSPVSNNSSNSFPLDLDIPVEKSTSVHSTWCVPLVVSNGSVAEEGFPPNCYLLPIGPNVFSAIYVKPPTQTLRRRAKGYQLNAAHYTKNNRPMRRRRNFDHNVKQRILELYYRYVEERKDLSVRSIASQIFIRLSNEM